MLRFRPADVTDPDAHALLDAYFAERSAGFPAEQGQYRPTWPSAEQFAPHAAAADRLAVIVLDHEEHAGGRRELLGARPRRAVVALLGRKAR